MKGEKTQTRRPIERKPGIHVYNMGEKVGVRAGYTKFVAYIVVKKRFRQRLGDISAEDAKKEGFPSTEDFKRAWAALYGWNPDQLVWVYEFELANSGSASKDKLFPLANTPSKPA